MTQPAPYPPAQPMPPQQPAQPRNGLGTAGFILGLIGLLFSWIPFVGVVAWPLVVLGIIFSTVGFVRVRKGAATNKGLSIAGMAVSIIGLIICIVMAIFAAVVVNEAKDQLTKEVTISYDVTGDAKSVDINYTTYGNESKENEEKAATLPWHKDITTKGVLSGGSVMAVIGEDGGTVTCSVSVDGQVKKTSTISGAFKAVDCTGF